MRHKLLFLITLFSLTTIIVEAQEVNCSDGIDNDLDGLVDLNDIIDCPCTLSGTIGTPNSLIPNHSFEDYTLCPTGPQQFSESVLYADSWEQISTPGPDLFNTCDPVFSGIVPAPIPDGNGVAGVAAAQNWLEYMGACLTTPLTTGVDYRMDFSVAAEHLDLAIQNSVAPLIPVNIKLALYGNTSCASPVAYPVATNTGINGLNGWQLLGFVTYMPSLNWSVQTITFTAPIDAQMIAFGPHHVLPIDYQNSPNFPYFFIDNMVLNEDGAFSASLDVTGELCLDNVAINATVPDPTTQWYFEGEAIPGQNTDNIDISAVGLGAGEYTLSITQAGACLYNSTNVYDNLYPEISYTLTDLCPAGDVTFSSTSFIPAGTIDTTEWTLPGNTYTTNDATESFSSGTHPITLTVTSNIGCVTDSTFNIIVEDEPFTNFSFTTECPGTATQFTDLSTDGSGGNNIAVWFWDFGDMSPIDITTNPTHTYAAEGDYTVSLTVATPDACSSDTTFVVSTHPVPVADFTSTVGCEGADAVTFVNHSTISSGTISNIAWDFGDTDAALDIDSIDHFYAAGGDYLVTLSVVSDQNCTNSIMQSATVSSVTTDFSTSSTIDCSPACIQFTDNSLSTAGTMSNWTWVFGDSLISTEENPGQCFTDSSSLSAISYTIQLISENEYGCIDSITYVDLITSTPAPIADFSFYPTEITTINPTVNFENGSSGNLFNSWQFGDQGISDEENPSFTFTDVGYIQILLTTGNGTSCSDSIFKFIKFVTEESIFVPDTFTPDEDGLNDLWHPVIDGDNIEIYELIVYDRVGRTVFKTEDPDEKWNGSYQYQNDYYVADGVFSWQMKVKFIGSTDPEVRQGSVNAIR